MRGVCPEKNQSSILIREEKNHISIFNISEFCSLTDRPTDKIFIEYMLKYERNVQKNSPLSYLGAKIPQF